MLTISVDVARNLAGSEVQSVQAGLSETTTGTLALGWDRERPRFLEELARLRGRADCANGERFALTVLLPWYSSPPPALHGGEPYRAEAPNIRSGGQGRLGVRHLGFQRI